MAHISKNLFVAAFGIGLTLMGAGEANAQLFGGRGGGLLGGVRSMVRGTLGVQSQPPMRSKKVAVQPSYGVQYQPVRRQYQPAPTQYYQPAGGQPVVMSSQSGQVRSLQSSGGQMRPAATAVRKPVTRSVAATGSSGVPPQVKKVIAAKPNTPAVTPPSGGNDAAMSALAALGGWDGSTPQPQPQQATPASQTEFSHVGAWKATLSTGATIELELAANGSFRWNALNNGKTSSFQGSYTFENGSLTLIRSDNSQQLGGAVTTSHGNAFNFKLNGSNDLGLEFARS